MHPLCSSPVVAAALTMLVLLPPVLATAGATDQAKPNVLFIAVDDLNDWVGCLGGHPQGTTPHIDRLAERGVVFSQAHCAAPLCNPSRTALLTGLRPSSSGVYDNDQDWREALPDVMTLPRYFMRRGYRVVGSGKIYHGRFPDEQGWHAHLPKGHDLQPAGADRGVGGIRFAPLAVDDDEMDDYKMVDWAIGQLAKTHERPLFLACGIYKPHMAWNVPRKYYDQFPLEEIVLPKVLDTDLEDVPPVGVRLAHPNGDHRRMLASGRWKEAVRAYLAASAFADAMIGRLLDALDKSRYADNTIIVLWGDHGWHLGEKLHWRKNTLWDEATRAPLIFVVPGLTRAGGQCRRPVDFMCIYPTLADLCGLPVPQHVEGVSIRPLLENPDAPWDRPAITTRGYRNHAIRTERWRYIRYHDGGEELYDHANDPMEWTNLAGKAEHAGTQEELARWLPARNVAPAKSLHQQRRKKKAKPGKREAE